MCVPCLSWSCGSAVPGWGCLGAGRWPCQCGSDSAGSFLAWTAELWLPWMCWGTLWAEDSCQNQWQTRQRTQVKAVQVCDGGRVCVWACVWSSKRRPKFHKILSNRTQNLLCVLQAAGQVLHSWIEPLCCSIISLKPIDDHYGNRGPPLRVGVAA